MYFIFRHIIRGYRNQTVQAILLEDIPDPQPHWWACQPLDPPLPPMIFTVNRNWPLPDNFFTGNLLNLYSTRLIEILADQGVKFETFPATLIDRKTEVALPISYEVFHLLERHPCIDKERSPTSGPLAVAEQVVLTEECMERQKLFFRAEEASELVFIHQRLKTILEDAGITGCRYITLDEYLKQAPIYLV